MHAHTTSTPAIAKPTSIPGLLERGAVTGTRGGVTTLVTGSDTDTGTGWPHASQNFEPGTNPAPHFEQVSD